MTLADLLAEHASLPSVRGETKSFGPATLLLHRLLSQESKPNVKIDLEIKIGAKKKSLWLCVLEGKQEPYWMWSLDSDSPGEGPYLAGLIETLHKEIPKAKLVAGSVRISPKKPRPKLTPAAWEVLVTEAISELFA